MMRAVLLTIVIASASRVLAPAVGATSSAPAMTLSAAIKAGDKTGSDSPHRQASGRQYGGPRLAPLRCIAQPHAQILDLVQRLLRAGANAKAKNEYGSTPLSEAAASGNAQIMNLLLKAGANPEVPQWRRPDRSLARGSNVWRTANVAAAELLIKAGANVNAREGWKPSRRR